MACSRMPKCSTRPYLFPVHSCVDRSAGTKDAAPSMVVLLDSARSADPPHNSGMTGPSAFNTLPDAARVETSLPASNTGRASSTPSGRAPDRMRSRSFFRSGLATAQASNCSFHSAWAALPRSTALRVCERISGSTSKVFSGSKPSTSLTALSSSAPSADPWILPVFCFFGLGHPMIVLRMMSDGFEVSAFAASIASFSAATSSTYCPVFFQSTTCTCQ